MFKFLVAILLITLSCSLQCKEKWKITSLEWQPFSGKSLPGEGSAIVVLREALKNEGIDLAVEFYPWSRAINVAKDPAYLGYYPAWPEEVTEGFDPSVVIYKSPIGFVERQDNPLIWSKLDDLNKKTIGIVQDYGNTKEFNENVKKGIIKVEISNDDFTNIKKVAHKRIDAALIDLNNLNYFLKYDAKEFAHKIQPNKKILTNKSIVLAINKKFPNKQAAIIIKRAMSKIKAEKIIQNYQKKY